MALMGFLRSLGAPQETPGPEEATLSQTQRRLFSCFTYTSRAGNGCYESALEAFTNGIELAQGEGLPAKIIKLGWCDQHVFALSALSQTPSGYHASQPPV